MYKKTREDKVAFIKRLICGEKPLCPRCEKSHLEHFHKKAKKSNLDYVCPACNERYEVIKMMDTLQ